MDRPSGNPPPPEFTVYYTHVLSEGKQEEDATDRIYRIRTKPGSFHTHCRVRLLAVCVRALHRTAPLSRALAVSLLVFGLHIGRHAGIC